MADRTRAMKMECPREGGNASQLDFSPTEVDPTQDAMDARGYYIQNGTSADSAVMLDRVAGNMRLTDLATSRLLAELVTSAQAGPAYHGALLDIVHWLEDGPGDGYASGAVFIRNLSGPLVTSDVWYTDSSLSKKILSKAYTYNGPLLQSLKYSLFAADGVTVARVLNDAYAYVGPILTQKTRTWS